MGKRPRTNSFRSKWPYGADTVVVIPEAPVMSDPLTLQYSDTTTGNITAAVLDGHTNVYLQGVWDRLVCNNIQNITFRNLDGNTRLGNAAGAFTASGCIGSLNGSTGCIFCGKSAEEPLILEGNNNGLQWLALAGGSSIKAQNVVVRDVGFAGALINTSDGTLHFTLVELYDFRIILLDTDGEPIYTGSTLVTNFSLLNQTLFSNIYGANKGRDGFQVNNHLDAQHSNITMYNVGAANGVNQNHLFQNQNCNGFCRNFVFHIAPVMGSIFTHGYVYENGYLFASDQIYAGRLLDSYTALHQAANRMPVLFIGIHFDSDVPIAFLFDVHEDQCDYILIGCTFGANIGDIFDDNRVDDSTHLLLNFDGSDATVSQPTYRNHDKTDFENHGVLTSLYNLNKGQGYRSNPALAPALFSSTIVSVVAIGDIQVNQGTAFGDIDRGSGINELPEVVKVNIAAGFQMTLPVTWAEGDYDGDVLDTYSITGTITLPYYLTNPGSLGANIDIEVVVPVFNPFDGTHGLDTAIDFRTSADLTNYGDDGDLTAVNTPVWDAAKNAMRYLSASSQRHTILAANAYAAPIDFLFEIITQASFSGTQTIMGVSNTHRMAISSTGVIQYNGTNGPTLLANTRYIIFFHDDGANSFYDVSYAGEVSISPSTGGIGTPTWSVGSAFTPGNYFNGWIITGFLKRGGMAAQLKLDLKTWYGF